MKLGAPWVGAALWLALFALGMPRIAAAGCGCDHPPPAYAEVMPAFGSPGRAIRIFARPGTAHLFGWTYEVSFNGKRIYATAWRSDSLTVKVPSGLNAGPVTIRVRGFGFDQTHGPEQFTALPAAPIVPASDGSYGVLGLQAAVASDGTLLVPFNLSNVLDAKQFALEIWNLNLAYGADDVVFYNADGVDLTLFTLLVDDPTARTWGSYFGWTVEDDTNLSGDVYEAKVVMPRNAGLSNLLTYWRHEFHTYRFAHLLSGSHWVNADGMHPDGTMHIDHDRLVLAIAGKKRSSTGALTPLAPGALSVNLALKAVSAPGPLEPGDMVDRLESTSTVRLLSTSSATPTSMSASLPNGDADDDDDAAADDDD
jgi:hypothetical protein